MYTVLIPGVSTLIGRCIQFFCILFQKLPRKTEWHRSRKYRLRESVLFSSRLSVTVLKIAKNHFTQKSTDSDLAHLLDYGLCHQNKSYLLFGILMFCGLLLIYCGVTFRTFSHHKTSINQKQHTKHNNYLKLFSLLLMKWALKQEMSKIRVC